jgi:hypothetical protein
MTRTPKARTLRTARLKAYPEKDIFISREALAERWDVHIETIKRDERNGLLQPVRLGERRIRYRLEEILAIEAQAKIARRVQDPCADKTAKDVLALRARATRKKAKELTVARPVAAVARKAAKAAVRKRTDAILSTLDREIPATQDPEDKKAGRGQEVTAPVPKIKSQRQKLLRLSVP